MKFGMTKGTGLALAAAVLAGCGAVDSVNELDGMTTSAGFNGVARKPINLDYPNQTRFLASNGFLPVSGPGDKCMASGYRPSSTFLCFSRSGRTEIAVRQFDFDGDVSDLRDKRDALQSLQARIVDLVAQDAATTQSGGDGAPAQAFSIPDRSAQLTAEANSLRASLADNNFFIFRWEGSDKAGTSGSFGALFSGSANRQEDQSGLVIVGGVTISSLLLGLGDAQATLGNYPPATKVATYTMGAEHLLYFNSRDLSAELEAKLQASGADLKDLSPQTQAAIQAFASIGRSYETQGSFTAATLHRLSPDDYERQFGAQHMFYSTMTDVETLLESLSE